MSKRHPDVPTLTEELLDRVIAERRRADEWEARARKAERDARECDSEHGYRLRGWLKEAYAKRDKQEQRALKAEAKLDDINKVLRDRKDK